MRWCSLVLLLLGCGVEPPRPTSARPVVKGARASLKLRVNTICPTGLDGIGGGQCVVTRNADLSGEWRLPTTGTFDCGERCQGRTTVLLSFAGSMTTEGCGTSVTKPLIEERAITIRYEAASPDEPLEATVDLPTLNGLPPGQRVSRLKTHLTVAGLGVAGPPVEVPLSVKQDAEVCDLPAAGSMTWTLVPVLEPASAP